MKLLKKEKKMKKISELDLAGKRVLMRCDFNVPLDKEGRVADDYRIAEAVPSIEHVVNEGGRAVLSLEGLRYSTLPESRARSLAPLPPQAAAYLTGPRRRLDVMTLKLWGVGWLSYQRRIAIPVRDWDGKLVTISGRCLDRHENGRWVPEQRPKFLHGKGFKRDYFLFGEHLVERGLPGILVEGHFDAMFLRQMGYPNTVAVMGSYLSQVQVEKALTMFSEVAILADGDDAGRTAAHQWEHALSGRVKVRPLAAQDGYDPDDYNAEELADLFLDNPFSSL